MRTSFTAAARAALAVGLAAGLVSGLAACTAKDVAVNSAALSRMLFGYIPPPEQTTVLQELTREYDRCVADKGDEVGCRQIAYDMVRKVKGMDRQPLPPGVVIIREENGTVIREVPVPPAAQNPTPPAEQK